MNNYIIDIKNYSIKEIDSISRSNQKIELSDNCIKAIQSCRRYLDDLIDNSEQLIYGINTGFGSLCNTAISKTELSLLQSNLVKSHACGVGARVPNFIVKRMLLLKILSLSKGYSGVTLQTIERLIYMYNNQIYPVVYEQGSLGASGDLAPLAHMSLPLIGLGEVDVNGSLESTESVYKRLGIEPLSLNSKEGLALLNGTQFMTAYGMYCVEESKTIIKWVNLISSISLEAYDCKLDPLFSNVNKIRNQKGQINVASQVLSYLRDSAQMQESKQYVQDPYSFRCIPQVHGASMDTVEFVSEIIEREINAVTDNPTIFESDEQIISAGNFHGQPLALSLDYLGIALAELGSISERRTYKLLSGTRELPAFLVNEPGLNSGLMIAQYTCASIVSQNKHLANPACTDTIDSSNGQEDHVSMGANAATKLMRILDNCYSIIGIELLTSTQAIEFRNIDSCAHSTQSILTSFRKIIPFIEQDVYLSELIKKSIDFIHSNTNHSVFQK